MPNLGYIGGMVVDVASLLVVVPGHLAILMVYNNDKKGLDIKDRLFCGLSIANLVDGLSQVTQDFVLILEVTLPVTILSNFIITWIRFTAMSCTLFFSTWLSVYFCLKIVNLKNKWYISLQGRFPKIFPWLLPFSVLECILCSFPLACHSSNYLKLNTTEFQLYLNGALDFFIHIDIMASVWCYIIVSLLWFMVFMSSSWLIIVSLYQHTRRIQVSTAGSRSPNLEPHINAIKTIAMLMILDVLFYFALTLFTFKGGELVWYYVTVTIFNFCHIASLVISIRENPKVQNKLKGTIRNQLGMRL